MGYIPEEKMEFSMKMSSWKKAIEKIRGLKDEKEIEKPENQRETVI